MLTQRGAALLAALALIAIMAMLAAFYAVHVEIATRTSTARMTNVENDLLALSACEELSAYSVLGLELPRRANRVVTNGAGQCVGAYYYTTEDAVTAARTAVWEVAWYRDHAGRWCLPVPAYSSAAELRRTLHRAMGRKRSSLAALAAACLSDALDADDELSSNDGEPSYEALVFARVQPTRACTAVLCAQLDERSWLNPGRLARGWGERYTAPMHFVVDRRRSKVSPRGASLVFSLRNLDSASRCFAEEVTRLAVPGLTPLGVAHQWRGAWIKAVGRDTDSCLGGALTNLMWLRVVDNVVEGSEMRFECEPVLEPTFPPEFVSNALAGTITYGFAGWHVHGDPLLANLPVELTEPELSGLLVPARCAAALATHAEVAYVGGSLVIRQLDVRERYRVVLVAPAAFVPRGLEVWDNNNYVPVQWENGRAVLYGGEPQQPLQAATGEGVLLIVFRVAASALRERQGLLGVELTGSSPEWHGYVTTRGSLDLRLWELVWLAPSGCTQTLHRIPPRCHGEVPEVAGGKLVCCSPCVTRLARPFSQPGVVTLQVEQRAEGPRARIIDTRRVGRNEATGLVEYHVRLAEPVRSDEAVSSWWVRCYATAAGVSSWSNVAAFPIALSARFASPHAVILSVPPILEEKMIKMKGGWMECVSDWRAWRGALAVRSPRGEIVARLCTDDLRSRYTDVTFAAHGWPPRWSPDARFDGASSHEHSCDSLGSVQNLPAMGWASAYTLLPRNVRRSATIAAACGDAVALTFVNVSLSNVGTKGQCVMLDGNVFLSNRVVVHRWAPLAPNILRGYHAQLALRRTRATGLIVSNDPWRIYLDIAGRVPRRVRSVTCTVTTPAGEPLWYCPAGESAECVVVPPWDDVLPTHFSLHVLQPGASWLAITLSGGEGGASTTCTVRSRVAWTSPRVYCHRNAPLYLSIRVLRPREGGVVFTRPGLCPLATMARKNINALTRAQVGKLFSHDREIARQLISARPLPGWVACAAFVPADDIWRLADDYGFVSLRWNALIVTQRLQERSYYEATLLARPRLGQCTCAAVHQRRRLPAPFD